MNPAPSFSLGARLRIVHADTDDIENPLRGGQPVRTYAVNSRLAARHDITVLTSVYRGSKRRLNREGIAYRRLGFRVPAFGLSPHLSFLTCLGPTIRSTPHDLVIEEFTPPVGFNGMPWWTKAPIVLIVQWFFFEQWERRYHLPFTRWMRRIARTGRYRHVIVQSEAMGRKLRELLPQANIRRIPPGIDESAFLPPTRGDYVLFLGRLDMDHKGLDLLLESWRAVCGTAKIPLVIAGEGPARAELQTALAKANLDGPPVRLIGRVEGEAKARAIEGSRVVVVPSRYETFGIAALEAMAASKPLVCYDIEHLNELAAPPWAVRVKPFDTLAFGHAVAELWQDPERCEAMGASARTEARRYHWDQIARDQENFYLEALSSST